jgi:hypothetical protein
MSAFPGSPSLIRLAALVALSTAGLAAWVGCGSDADDSLFDEGGGDGGNAEASATPSFPPPSNDAGSGDGGDGGAYTCTGLACKRVYCPDGGTTSLSGTVVSPRPNDPDPIYNAVVYVPNAPVAPFTEGVACERCGAEVSGNPIAVALTGIDGKFVLTDVPVTDNLPLVIQIGRWRRQVTVSTVTACSDTPIATTLTHLPRSKAEGDIPKMALKTGDSDSPECVLRKMGIDEAEFTAPNGGGRIEVYQGEPFNPPILDGGIPAQGALLDDLDRMKRYDLVLLPCDGEGFDPTTASMKNLEQYADLGGKIFASHYSYEFMKQAPAPSKWPNVATWNPAATVPPSNAVIPGYINTSFPKAKAMSDWLQQLGAADGGVIPELWQPRRDVNAVAGDTLEWIRTKSPDHVGHFSFNTPVGVDAGAQCGRVVFNDFHTVNVYGGQTGVFPAHCGNKNEQLTSQERVFEFMLFDLSSCVQKDDLPPVPPPSNPPGGPK